MFLSIFKMMLNAERCSVLPSSTVQGQIRFSFVNIQFVSLSLTHQWPCSVVWSESTFFRLVNEVNIDTRLFVQKTVCGGRQQGDHLGSQFSTGIFVIYLVFQHWYLKHESCRISRIFTILLAIFRIILTITIILAM